MNYVKKSNPEQKRFRKKIDVQINKLQEDDENQAQLLPLSGLNFDADVEQKVPKLLKYLEKRKNVTAPNQSHSGLKVKPLKRHYRSNKHAPTVSEFKQLTNEVEKNLFANDFENWALYGNVNYHPKQLRECVIDYILAVNKFYRDDQLSSSRMILVYLKLIATLDTIACKEHPLLKQYRTSINPNIINSLLIHQRKEMEIASKLQEYFKIRNANATGPGLIEEQSITPDSFSVKFSEQNRDMQNILDKIKQIEKQKIEDKRQEWQYGQQEVQRLRNQAANMVHTNYYNWIYNYTRHDKFCLKCAVEKKIRNMQIQMYERPLPTESYAQNAVVFELRCPIEIACLRDVLFSFANFCDNPKEFEFERLLGATKKGGWLTYHQIEQYDVSDCVFITLGGSNSSYLHERHVDYSFDTFIGKNGINCTFYGSNSTLPSPMSDDCIKTVCTYSVENEYDSLQWTLNGTQHTQNEVLSRQNDCHIWLSLSEFKNFGSLRADGHRLQLRKLYAMIETESLSFEQLSVLSLVMQTLWEAGVSGDDGAIRESHIDFNDTKFASAMIELLDKCCEQQKNNWVSFNYQFTFNTIYNIFFTISDASK